MIERNFKKICLILICVLFISAIYLSFNNNMCYAKTQKNEEFMHFSSTSYVLIDKNSESVLVSFNENEKMPVASICKLMTTLITLEEIEKGNLSLDDLVLASPYACSVEGSQAFLDAGSKYKVSELLKSVIVASANDSAIVLAETISGNEKSFVKKMNERAKELGMENTNYENATGLNTSNQYSTALDTAKILKEVSKHDIYLSNCGIWMDSFIHPSGRVTELVNTNRLIRYFDYCKTGKTGFTDEAGYCLVSNAEKDGLDLIAVTLNCKDSASRFKESMELFNYGFANYENGKVVDCENLIENNIKVVGGNKDKVEIKAEKDFFYIMKKGDLGNITTKLELPKNLKAEIKEGDIVGKILILNDGAEIGSVNVISVEKIEKQKLKDIFEKIGKNWGF